MTCVMILIILVNFIAIWEIVNWIERDIAVIII